MLVGVIFFGAGSLGMAQDPLAILEESVVKLVEKSEPAVVSVARFKPVVQERMPGRHRPFFNSDFPVPRKPDLQPNDFGAGCLISPPQSDDRLLLTAYHLVRGGPVFPNFTAEDKTELMIRLTDRRECRAAILAADPRSDLAVLHLDWDEAKIKSTDFPVLDWENGLPPRKGQFIVLMGNPYAIARDGSASVSFGMVSNLTRQSISLNRSEDFEFDEVIKSSTLHRLGVVMQLDARLNLGLSGGPVLNLKGELIGISSSLAAIEGYDQSAGFAFPIDRLTRRVIRTLLAGQEVEYGMIGIGPVTIDRKDFPSMIAKTSQPSAAMVRIVSPGSPAGRAGILPGDLILKVAGQPVLSLEDLMRLIGLNPPGTELKILLLRRSATSGQPEEVTVKLGKWPVQDFEGIIETNPRYLPWRGLTVDYPTAQEKFRDREGHYDFRHVLVTRVKLNSPAEVERIMPGDFITHVNNTPVQTPTEFYSAVKGLSGPVTLRFYDKQVRLADPAGGRD